MYGGTLSIVFDALCFAFGLIFFWSTFIVLAGLLKPSRRHPKSSARLRFAVLICARNEAAVIRRPVKSIALSKYPAELIDTIVIADNCTDDTAERARAAGAIVWEKATPSSGKGDVLAWGVGNVVASGKYDAIAVFDADNISSNGWFEAVNDALNDGETVVTGRRGASNAATNVISGWYAIYWDIMNELSNRVRTNLWLSGKLTGTGFAFLISALGPEGWKTHTMVEDVEFTVQTNLRGQHVGYVPVADYADEQPESAVYMWRQLRRWSTGGWQVSRSYFIPWVRALFKKPSLRLFDSYFAILTGMSMPFVLLFNLLALVTRICNGTVNGSAIGMFTGILGFVFTMGWITAIAAVGLSHDKRRPQLRSVLLFPVFSLILSGSVLYTLFFPTRRWKPIPHTAE